ncbi:hypothetical protein A2215_04390 [Candidatus Berkelbacteria bacterium RIFOXYA2_FULL_43_10]|uniref:Uncharacterized protein n=1 Tax=Candidatus Berkelbacteria bacterium RIFOXYA2_FULL_43_10 TaxID=1797472 RepID=A0A1F5E3K1_9BACT|nr:MAG: hypothetical protein A2215_04390 [Candidatus Berkelbacteria bacterium RIFOXYA2_FULL_43_10]
MSKTQNGVKSALTNEQIVKTWQRCAVRMNATGSGELGMARVNVGFALVTVTGGVGVFAVSGCAWVWVGAVIPAFFTAMAVVGYARHGRARKATEELASNGIVGTTTLRLAGEVKQVRVVVDAGNMVTRYVPAPLDLVVLGQGTMVTRKDMHGFTQYVYDFPKEQRVFVRMMYEREGELYVALLRATFVAGGWEDVVGATDDIGHLIGEMIGLITVLSARTELGGVLREGTIPDDYSLRKMLNEANGGKPPKVAFYVMTRAHLSVERAE